MQGESSFGAFLGERLRRQRKELTRRWVTTLEEQLTLPADRVLPSEDLLNHIPRVLANIAESLTHPENSAVEKAVVEDLGELAELRRRQGFGLEELLREYRLLAEIVQSSIEYAADEYEGYAAPSEVVRTSGRLAEAIQRISAVTARSFDVWRARYEQERRSLLESYGQVISHELNNRLGAAETAVRLLLSSLEVDPDKQRRLLELVLEGIAGAMETIHDVSVLARPLQEQEEPSVPLGLLVRETVRFARAKAEDSRVSVALVGEVPDVRVPGSAVRIALSNLLSNAIKFQEDDAEDPWVRLSVAPGSESGFVELTVEDNGPGIPKEVMDRIFEYRYRGDVEEDGSGLGLAVAKDALTRVAGTIRVEEGREGGVRFTVAVPAEGSSSASSSGPESHR